MQTNELLAKLFSVLERYKLPLVLVLSGFLVIGVGLLLPRLSPEKKAIVVESKSDSTGTKSQSKVKVDIAGAVMQPGVYEIATDARVEDAVSAAGGFSEAADTDWVAKNINLASKVSDGQKIYIKTTGESESVGSSLGASTVSGKVNINFASMKELDTLPGIGPVTAEKIIASRPYNAVEELLTKKAVGSATYEKIKGLVSVN